MAEPTLLDKTVVPSLFFVCGAFASVLGNILYTTKAVPLHNREIAFREPWFQGRATFVGMSFLIVDTPAWRTWRCARLVSRRCATCLRLCCRASRCCT
jgi:hypothetical protein